MLTYIIGSFKKTLLLKLKDPKAPVFQELQAHTGNKTIHIIDTVTSDISLLGQLCQYPNNHYPTLHIDEESKAEKLRDNFFLKEVLVYYYNAFKLLLSETIKEDNHLLFLNQILNADSFNLRTILDEKIKLFFLPADLRIYSTQRTRGDRKLRRLDSLARILSLSNDYSACCAVTIYNDMLIVAANIRNENIEKDAIQAIQQRIEILRKICMDLAKTLKLRVAYNSQDTSSLDEEIKIQLPAFIQQLVTPIGSHILPIEYQQAVYKFIHTMLLDQETFIYREKEILLELPIAVVTPSLLRTNTNFARFDIQHFHAEQLIHYYLNKIIPQSAEKHMLAIGISKLACRLCHQVLSSNNNDNITFIYSGTHGKQFAGTVDVNTVTQVLRTSPEKPAKLTAYPSPFNTPAKNQPAQGAGDEENIPTNTIKTLLYSQQLSLFNSTTCAHKSNDQPHSSMIPLKQ